MPELKENQEFTAVDKLNNKYKYRFIKRTNEGGCRYIKLWNIDTDSLTEVEDEWFNQRKIIMN